MNEWLNEWMKSRGWEDNRRALFTIHFFKHVNSKLARQHTKAPLAAALSPFISLITAPTQPMIMQIAEGVVHPLRTT